MVYTVAMNLGDVTVKMDTLILHDAGTDRFHDIYEPFIITTLGMSGIREHIIHCPDTLQLYLKDIDY